MNAQQVIDADDIVGRLSELANSMPDEKQKCVEMALHLNITRSYLISFAKCLLEGDEPYDALLRTARGDVALPESPALTTFRLMTSKPAADPDAKTPDR